MTCNVPKQECVVNGVTKQTLQMLNIGTQMMNVPVLSDLPIITRRYIKAAILKNVFDEIQKRFDRKTAEQIIGRVCSNLAKAHREDMT